ncbi:hypothetical protein CVT25_008557 [Psilocybe cyanescens]|uniref:Uncharacterized protein n=1 Tax=Psilocybe cyanescens TaxID=93625 RepID=A0A409XRL2_PSICY|nr:hypothetical protein CVT25_008557 [Psilocybe cyanescens]
MTASIFFWDTAVKSLKSKFEKLALKMNNTNYYRQSELLAVSMPPSPAASGSHTNTPAEAISLRGSSFSSDLRAPTKRVLPLPPSRNSKLNIPTASPSTSISPLLCPGPLPPVGNYAGKEPKLAPSIACLKARLRVTRDDQWLLFFDILPRVPTPPGSPTRIHTPRKSLSSYPILQGETKPILPPRPTYLPASRNTASPETVPPSSIVHSPFSDDEGENAERSTSKITPPPIPLRQYLMEMEIALKAAPLGSLGHTSILSSNIVTLNSRVLNGSVVA